MGEDSGSKEVTWLETVERRGFGSSAKPMSRGGRKEQTKN